MNKELFDFYTGEGRTTSGATWSGIMESEDDFWERCHDFIQWMFPLTEPSRFNPDAPILDAETIAELERNEVFRDRFRDSVYRFQVFLSGVDWCTRGNHNLLRISRVIRSAKIFGFDRIAYLLYKKYSYEVTKTLGANNPALLYWKIYMLMKR